MAQRAISEGQVRGRDGPYSSLLASHIVSTSDCSSGCVYSSRVLLNRRVSLCSQVSERVDNVPSTLIESPY